MISKLTCTLFVFQLLVFGTIDKIQKALEKKEFDKAEELIQRGYEKEPNNPGVNYYHALLLFDSTYDGFDADSARIIINKAITKYEEAPEELVSEINEEGITIENIQQLSDRIKNYLFQTTLKDVTLSSIESFRLKYPSSIFDAVLVFKRDSIIFDTIRSVNTKEGYIGFINQYPTSIFKVVADSLLDVLRYEDLEANGTLKDYYVFLKHYPLTNYSRKIESYILRNSTASHDTTSYTQFIQFAKNENLKKRAGDILYYLAPKEALKIHPKSDSIYQVHQLTSLELFPVMDQNSFGFYTTNYFLQIPYQYNEIQYNTKCQTSIDDWLLVFEGDSGRIINKNNELIINNVDDYQSLNDGLAIISTNGKRWLYHKSGYKVIDNSIVDAEAIDHQWIKIKQNDKWGLYTFLGLPIAQSIYDDIYQLGDFWVFEKNGLLGVYTEALILKEIEERGLSLEFKFEDVELVNQSMLIGFRGNRECLMDNEMNFLIPWGEYEIYPDPSGWYLKTNEGYKLYNNADDRIMNRNYTYLESNEGWLILKTEEDWMLLPKKSGRTPTRGYDSLKIINPYTVLSMKEDQNQLLFGNGNTLTLKDHEIRSFTNHPEYVLISNNGSTGLYNEEGELIIDGTFSSLTFLNDSLVKVTIDKKQGLLTTKGKYLLNPLFDSMDEKEGLVLTLLGGKIGCLDLKNNTLISPNYESRITSMGDNYLARKDGNYGIINGNEDVIISFQYQKITQWNDSLYLVEQDGQLFVIDEQEEIIIEPMEELNPVFEYEDHTIYRFVKNGKFGLISNRWGTILMPEFTDILNIGSREKPLFFADQNLTTAGYHVITYLNEEGKVIFSKAYRKEEFDRILCDD